MRYATLLLLFLSSTLAITVTRFCVNDPAKCSLDFEQTKDAMENEGITNILAYVILKVSQTDDSETFAQVSIDFRTSTGYERVSLRDGPPFTDSCFDRNAVSCFAIDTNDIKQAALYFDDETDGLCITQIAIVTETATVSRTYNQEFTADISIGTRGCVFLKKESTTSTQTCWNFQGGNTCVCPVGQESDIGANKDEYCSACEAGEYNGVEDIGCQDCLPGTYNDLTGQTACTDCPQGTYSSDTRAIAASVCTGCPAGSFGSAPALSAVEQCTTCPAGKYNGATSQIQCTDCLLGKYSPIEGAQEVSVCTNCPAGTYAQAAALSAESECTECPAGTYNALTGQSECTNCPLGKYSPTVRGQQDSVCINCPTGTFAQAAGLPSLASCTNCPVGTYNDIEEQTECKLCDQGTFNDVEGISDPQDCQPCPLGRWGDAEGLTNQLECVPCGTGRFGNVLGSTTDICQDCPAGSYNVLTAQSDCVLCGIGTWSAESPKTDAECNPCPAGTYGEAEGLDTVDSCTACPAGRYNVDGAATSLVECIPCEQGKYQAVDDKTTADSCQNCPLGRYGPLEGSSDVANCEDCIPGRSGEVPGIQSADDCELCNLGTFGFTDRGGCDVCGAGTFQDETGQFNCKICGAGYFSELNAFDCNPCLPGKFSTVQSGECTECAIGFFANESATEFCTQCPLNSETAEFGSIALSECQCSPGFYGTSYLGDDCTICPISVGANCPGGTDFPEIAQGFWISDDLLIVTACSPAEACLASADGTSKCAEGYTGEFCSECVLYKYYRLSGVCEKCPGNNYLLWFALSILVFIGIFILLKTSIAFARKTHSIGIVITWIQVISLYGSLPLQWPGMVKSMYNYASLVNFNIELFSPDCSVPLPFWVKWGAQLMFPLIFAFVMFLFYLFHHLWNRMFKDMPSFMATPFRDIIRYCMTGNPAFLEYEDPYRHSRYFYGFSMIMTICYTFLVSKTIQPLNCVKQEDGTWRMAYDIKTTCYTSAWYAETLPPVFASTLVYVVGIPTFTMFVLWKYRKDLFGNTFLSYYGGLVLPYRDRYVWFEVVNMIRKATIAILLEFNGSFESKAVHVFTTEAILFIILLVQYFMRPYTMVFNNSLAFMWILVSIFCLFTGIIFASETLFEWEKNVFAVIVLIMFNSALVLSLYALSKELKFFQEFGEKIVIERKRGETEVIISDHLPGLLNSRRSMLKVLFPHCHSHLFDHLYLLDAELQRRIYMDLERYHDLQVSKHGPTMIQMETENVLSEDTSIGIVAHEI